MQQGTCPTRIDFAMRSSGVECDASFVAYDAIICIKIDTACMVGEFRDTEVVVWYHVPVVVMIHEKAAFAVDLCLDIQFFVPKSNSLELQLLVELLVGFQLLVKFLHHFVVCHTSCFTGHRTG
jgi:hypothetical protein